MIRQYPLLKVECWVTKKKLNFTSMCDIYQNCLNIY